VMRLHAWIIQLFPRGLFGEKNRPELFAGSAVRIGRCFKERALAFKKTLPLTALATRGEVLKQLLEDCLNESESILSHLHRLVRIQASAVHFETNGLAA